MVGLQGLDWIIVGLYFIVLFVIVWWVIKKKQKDTKDYFLAGRNVGWFIVGASIFASNIGSEHVVGLAGTGAASGMPLAHFELHAWIVLLLGWVFLPFYARSGVFTTPEFIEKRFDSRSRWFLSVFSIIGYVLTKVSVSVYAGGVVIQSLMGLDFWTGALITVVLTGIYTVLGGMRAVVYTEALQTVVLIAGALLVLFIGLDKIGGWGELKTLAGSDHFNMWRPSSDPDFPWTGLLFGGAIVGVWYWCTDQYIVQRVLAARNMKQGLRGSIFGGFLKILPVFIFLIPGMIAYAMTKTGQLQLDSYDQALPVMMATLLPTGVRGLVAAGLLAALMSSLASVFNSCSTLITVDIYKKLRPETPEKKLVNVGRVATSVVVILGILWIPIMSNISGVLYEYIQSVQSYISPPIATIFLLGIFWKRINGTGALVTLVTGFFLGMFRLVIEAFFIDNVTGILHDFATINFLHFCVYMFLFCVVLCITVSLLTKPQDVKDIQGLSRGTLSDEQKKEQKDRYGMIEMITSVFIVLVIIWILTYFTG